ncbi:Transposon Tf2-11 polyprotein [Zancudomyces culisetae]|uniref:Transposon Tf2-11 polyprotein n=1 Tax=Zancudomyces culisetae TaxID=1213189 RepID=A0A1R1PD01_ZANCU|nr:Transposon Tf2-11 polyprotein [Zancudomyces culisetae]|eukprot:OMH78867.1 Transposon Tf2-11 polyprotein [Zancudomyces culisetae]
MRLPIDHADITTKLATHNKKGNYTSEQEIYLLLKEDVQMYETEYDTEFKNIVEDFKDIFEKLVTAPILGFPDWNEELVLTTDASVIGIGAVLSQVVQGEERVIEYASHSTNKAEQNYSKSHLEALAVVWSVKKFKYYLWGRKFRIKTDHKSLLQIFNGTELTGRIARWAMILWCYDYEIEHLPGRLNPADMLSRNIPVKNNEDNIVLDVCSMDINEYVDVLQYLSTMQYPKGAEAKDREKIRNRARQYYLKDGKLFKKVKKVFKEVLHERNFKEIISNIHNEGHEGIENTWRRVTEKYTGKNLYNDVFEIVKSCLICQFHKDGRTKNNELYPILTSKPFQIFGIDAIGPIASISKNENSDRGSSFVSDSTTNVFEWLGLKHRPTTSNRPQSNGQVERLNRTLVNI